jgi:outer membrane protein assembly factor BamB
MKRPLALLVLVAAACTQARASAPTCAPPLRTGDAQWSVPLDDAPTAAAADADGVVVTASGGTVWAFDRGGREVWRTEVMGIGLDWPVIDGDLVVFPVTTAAGAACVGLDRASGAERWRVDAGPGIVAVTGAASGRVVCASARGRLVTVDRATGAVLWSLDVEEFFDAGPVDISPRGAVAIDPDAHARTESASATTAGVVTVVLRVRGHWIFSCWDLATGGEARCGLDLGGAAPASAVAGAGGAVFVVGSGSTHDVALIDVEAGTTRAFVPTADAFDPANIPLVTAGLAVVVDRSGQVTAVDVETGRRRWRAELGYPILDAKPAAAAGVVRIVDWTGRIHALRLADGHRAAPVDEEGGAIGVVADPAGTLVVTLRRGLGGERLDGFLPGQNPSEPGRARPLQCSVEPGQSTRNDARP